MSFAEDLAWGEAAGSLAFWEATYRAAIPGFDVLLPNRADNRSQRRGIDDVILLADGSTRRIQKKQRRTSCSDRDLALEFLHSYDDDTTTLGWIEIDLAIDFFGMGFPHLSKAYLFPWMSLRAAWLANRDEWLGRAQDSWTRRSDKTKAAKRGASSDGFFCLRSRNPTYWSWNVAVPTSVLLDAVRSTIVVDVPGCAA